MSDHPLQRLRTRLEALPEWPMRIAVFDELISSVPVEEAVSWVSGCIIDAATNGTSLHPVYITMVGWVLKTASRDPARTEGLYNRAMELDRVHAAAIFFGANETHLVFDESEFLPHPELADLPLGTKKAFTRKASLRDLRKLHREKHPHVIEILLNHPVQTESEVLRYVAQRPLPPEIAYQISLHPRWMVRYEVRRALVLNPYTPLDVSMKYLPLFERQHLREIADATDIHPYLQEWASKLIEGR